MHAVDGGQRCREPLHTTDWRDSFASAQALAMKVPADLYARSPRVYRGLEELTYPFHDQTILVTGCGRRCFRGRKVNLSHVFAGQRVGVTQVGERLWLVTFMHYDLGYFDDETCR
jgi:putative transposase